MTGKGTCLHVSTICFWVAGGFSTVKLYNRIRGDRLRGVQKVTLLTLLTYFTGGISHFWFRTGPLKTRVTGIPILRYSDIAILPLLLLLLLLLLIVMLSLIHI